MRNDVKNEAAEGRTYIDEDTRRRLERAFELVRHANEEGRKKSFEEPCLGTVEDLCQEVAQRVVGREAGIRQVVEHLHMRLRVRRLILEGIDRRDLINARSLLLVGPSASSKNFIVSEVCRAMGLHYVSASLASLSGVGWRGRGIDNVLYEISQRQAEQGRGPTVLLLDECDKHRHVPGSRVNEMTFNPACDLLSILDNYDGVYHGSVDRGTGKEEYVLNLDDLIVVFAGAFQDIPEVVRRRLAREAESGYGPLSSSDARKVALMDDDALRLEIKQEDIVAYGILAELVGRAGYLCALPSLTEDELRRIVNDSPNSLQRKSERVLRDGVRFVIEDDAALGMARRARESSLGARMLENMLQPVVARAQAATFSNDDISLVRITWDEDARALSCAFHDEAGRIVKAA